MKELVSDLSKGIWALPPFPVVLVTVAGNIMTAGAFHFYSLTAPSSPGLAPGSQVKTN